ncbi:MAG: hypothetical protein J6V44_05210 [Methanobrevibacter sp.]|nr:hypothetical protein [Methanobrevibacter sp.]
MFGYKLIREVEIENLKKQLSDIKTIANTQANRIVELEKTVKEQETVIANLTNTAKVNSEVNEEKVEKPVKKVRRKSSKKNTKKEE